MTQTQKDLSSLIHHILDNTSYSQPGLNDQLDNAIRHFPEFNYDGQNTWKSIDLYLKHHRISEKAAIIINSNLGMKDLWKLVHYEHIIPVLVTKKALVGLGENPKLNEVIKIMKETEVIILSREEANVLDGRKNQLYPLEGKMIKGKGMRAKGTKTERLGCLNIKIDKRYQNNKL